MLIPALVMWPHPKVCSCGGELRRYYHRRNQRHRRLVAKLCDLMCVMFSLSRHSVYSMGADDDWAAAHCLNFGHLDAAAFETFSFILSSAQVDLSQ